MSIEVQCVGLSRQPTGVWWVRFEPTTQLPVSQGGPTLTTNGITLVYGEAPPFIPSRVYRLEISDKEIPQ